MTRTLQSLGLTGCLAAIAVAACSSGSQTVASKYVAQATIGVAGGTITVTSADDATLNGTKIVIPANALSASTQISIGLATGSVAPSTGKAAGPVVDFEPSPLKFLVPVTITIPTTATSASNTFVEAVELNGDTSVISVTSVSDELATFKATGFTEFGVWTGTPATSGTCSTDTDCAAGEACVNGECASSNLVDGGNGCGDGVCSSGETCESCPADCGACSGSCTTDADCASGQACVSGECLTSGETDGCAPATCVSLGLTCGITSDGCGGTINCGTCALDAGPDAATDATDAATDGDAAPCSDVVCNGVCVDLSDDNDNCGACGAECAAGMTCVDGACST